MYHTDSAARSISRLPADLRPFLHLLDEPAGLSVCRECEAAILPKSLLDHLRKHHQLPVELRKAVRALVATLPPLDFNSVPNKPDGSAPLDDLRVVNAYQCKHCPLIRRDLTDVRKHINKEHQLSATEGYGQIQAQSWFGGRRAAYWRVCVAPKEKEGEGLGCVWGFYGKWPGNRPPAEWPRENEKTDTMQ